MTTARPERIHDLQQENRLLKKKLQTQTEQFKEERSRLLHHRDSLQSFLHQEHHRHQEIAAEFDRRMAHLESELRQIQSVPHSHLTRSPHFPVLSFSVLEMEANRLQEETDRICGTFRPNSELEFSPRRTPRFPFDTQKPPTSPDFIPDRPPPPPAPPRAPIPAPIHSDKPSKPQQAADELLVPDFAEDLFPLISPKEEIAPAPAPAHKPAPAPALAPAPAHKPAPAPAPPPSEKPPQKSTFVAHPISPESSGNDDFFENPVPSPVSEPVKQQSPPIQKKSSESSAVKPKKQNPPPVIRRQSSASSDPFGQMDVSFDLPSDDPPPKAKKADPPKKKSAPPPQKKPPPVKEKNSAETFEIDPDEIKFDFGGFDPFG
jgi:hypothetical protein